MPQKDDKTKFAMLEGKNRGYEGSFATMKKELIHWTHYKTKESVRAAVFEYILLLQCEENPEEARRYVAERMSRIIEKRESGEGSLANCLQNS